MSRAPLPDLPPVSALPQRQGLYDPAYEHDACGVGFVANMHGVRSHKLVRKGVEILENLAHRGATGADPNTGDGAGILLQIPDRFFRDVLDVELPERYAVGVLFLSPVAETRHEQQRLVEAGLGAEGLETLAWRQVPVREDRIGETARRSRPFIAQVFVDIKALEGIEAERALFKARRRFEKATAPLEAPFHAASLSARTIVYKGLLLAHQIVEFYPDLDDERVDSAIAIVHQRYSTNTFPTWDLAHPFRCMAANGEINTLRGNINWMRARRASLATDLLGPDGLETVLPVVEEGRSDSALFDNTLELLTLTGRSFHHALAMMIPEAWEHHERMDPERRAFYAYHANLSEPWDGPSAICFTDGQRVGAVLDRNGLRPLRYTVTRGGYVVVASEAGALAIAQQDILHKGRLRPGRFFIVDTEAGHIVDDDTLKAELAGAHPYADWLRAHQIELASVPVPERAPPLVVPRERVERQVTFGYTLEDMRLLLVPMADRGTEAIGSMGDDAALACLSSRPRLLFEYFKQHFAQVTNPAIDSLREKNVMALFSRLGPRQNLLAASPEHARSIQLASPILSRDDWARLGTLASRFGTHTLDATFPIDHHSADPRLGRDLERALERLCAEAASAVTGDGASILVLTDRDIGRGRAPIPILLATAALHHHLVREGIRTQTSVVVDTAEAREVSHMALLIGYGASAIHPYLAFSTIDALVEDGKWLDNDPTPAEACANYISAIDKGLLKIFAKLGMSTLQSYQAAQMFEILGLDDDLVEAYFPGTPSRIGGIGLDIVAGEVAARHKSAWLSPHRALDLDPGGLYQWRQQGERHTFEPDVVSTLQHAVRQKSFETYQAFADLANKTAADACTLRGLLAFDFADTPLPIEQVEPAASIARRFCTGAMSYGSISKEAHETLAIAMNRLGGRSNTGEGGEAAARFAPDDNGDSRRSAIKQVASGRFGVTSHYLVNADEIQIKIAQGAKPGEGGQLPGHKVDATIARLRHSTPGVSLISPPPHHDIYSIEDLSQLIWDLKCANPEARISVKLVARSGVGTIAAGVAKGKADGIVISGHDGGTGASPQTSIKSAGVPWEIGLAETQQTLSLNGLRDRVRLQVDGGLKTGRDVVVAALLGADEFGFATAPLVAMGCILMRVCHLNTCPVGIATQNPELRVRFDGQPEHVINYLIYVAEEVRMLMARLGFATMDAMIGQVERLTLDPAPLPPKSRALDLSALLHAPEGQRPRRYDPDPDPPPTPSSLDHELLQLAQEALEHKRPTTLSSIAIRNVDRSAGTLLGYAISKRHGAAGLPEDTLVINYEGVAGQSFGAFAPRGLTLKLEGEANDYVGKGLSGGRIAITPPRGFGEPPHENVIAGNVVLYGATAGEVYLCGQAGERFAVRNSGAMAVVEGIGDHGCEYMTGGRVFILGPVGRNFAAGMSGGVAYVYDPEELLEARCNTAMVEVGPLDVEDALVVRAALERHIFHTGSPLARALLSDPDATLADFTRVIPVDYKRHLQKTASTKTAGHPPQRRR